MKNGGKLKVREVRKEKLEGVKRKEKQISGEKYQKKIQFINIPSSLPRNNNINNNNEYYYLFILKLIFNNNNRYCSNQHVELYGI